MPFSPTFEYLEFLFPGRVMIDVIEAGRCLGYADQTTYNLVSTGKFPVPIFKIKGKQVRKLDLALYIENLGTNLELGKLPSRRPGRPQGSTKAAKIEAAKAGAI